VLADNEQPRFTSGLRRGRFKNRDFEAFTISWLPHDFDTNPHLCVFDGIGSRVDPKKNKCPISVGRNFKLDETVNKKDLYGFVYVPERNSRGVYNPFPNASAYHR
jgi:hypothetical protein